LSRNLSVMSLEVRCTRFCHAADPQQYNFTNNTTTPTSPFEVAVCLSITPKKKTALYTVNSKPDDRDSGFCSNRAVGH